MMEAWTDFSSIVESFRYQHPSTPQRQRESLKTRFCYDCSQPVPSKCQARENSRTPFARDWLSKEYAIWLVTLAAFESKREHQLRENLSYVTTTNWPYFMAQVIHAQTETTICVKIKLELCFSTSLKGVISVHSCKSSITTSLGQKRKRPSVGQRRD